MSVGPEGLLAAGLSAVAVVIAVPPHARWPSEPGDVVPQPPDDPGWLHRWRWLWASLAGVGAATFVSGPWNVPAALVAGAATWVWIGRAEPTTTRRRREAAARELPGLVHLLATALDSGCDIADALRLACEALPGAAAEVLGAASARLALGAGPETAWRPILDHPELTPLGRSMLRAHRSGSSVTHEVARLADELDDRTRVRVEERARAVGVKAAVPLGICLLPSFLLIGVVPLVAALLRSLSL